MTTATTARALRDAGLVWRPTKGDRFVIPDRGMDGDVFVVSDMTIEAHDLPSGQVLGFNGTTEWALDSVDATEVLWLPREGQLREQLGESFAGLGRRGGLWAVRVRPDRAGGADVVTLAPDAEEAYALALLSATATTASQLLPVAAAALAARLVGLEAGGWSATAPDGVLTVTDVVAGAVGGLGADPAASWPQALDSLLQAWAAAQANPDVAEAGVEGVLVDLACATWDVARATGQDDVLDPAVVRRALEHVRTWPTTEAPAGEPPPPDASGPSAPSGEAQEQAELLRLTGRG